MTGWLRRAASHGRNRRPTGGVTMVSPVNACERMSARGVVMSDGEVVTCADEPTPYAPTVHFGHGVYGD